MREDPHPGETVELVVTAAESRDVEGTGDGTDVDDVASALEAAGATVEERLRFGALRVTVDQAALEEVCQLEGIASIETAATRDLAGGDAGEDV